MFLAVCDVLVEARTLEIVYIEELREDTRVRVDHVDVGVAIARPSFSLGQQLRAKSIATNALELYFLESE